MLLKVIKIRLDELAFYLVTELVAFIFGVGVMALVAYLASADPVSRVFRLGTVCAIGAVCFMQVMFGIFGLSQLFNNQVAFGMTRKKFICYDVIVSLIQSLDAMLFAVVLYFLEGGILKVLFKAYPETDILEGILEIKLSPGMLVPVVLLVMVCLTALKELLGSLVMRFGNKAFWVIWAIWMLACLLPGRISQSEKGGAFANLFANFFEGLWERLARIPASGWGAAGVVFAIAAFAVSWIIVRKQAVAA